MLYVLMPIITDRWVKLLISQIAFYLFKWWYCMYVALWFMLHSIIHYLCISLFSLHARKIQTSLMIHRQHSCVCRRRDKVGQKEMCRQGSFLLGASINCILFYGGRGTTKGWLESYLGTVCLYINCYCWLHFLKNLQK